MIRDGAATDDGRRPVVRTEGDDQGTSAVPYLALIAAAIPLARSTCPPAAGWMPSSEKSAPYVAVVLPKFGKGGIEPSARLAA